MFVLSLLIIVFSIKSYDHVKVITCKVFDIEDTEIIPPSTDHPLPPPPPPVIDLEIVENDEIIEDEPEIIEPEIDKDADIEIFIEDEKIIEDDVVIFAEEMPQFPGGDPEMMKYLSNNIKYPALAVDNGVEGTVIITFIVNKKETLLMPRLQEVLVLDVMKKL